MPKAASARPEPVSPYGVVEGHRFQAKPPPWELPVSGYRLTGRFGQSSGLWSSTHTGLDFAAPEGSPISSIGPGVVDAASYDGAYGNKMVVRLDDGTELWFCHLSAFEAEVGQRLAPGDVLGRVGSTGNVTGPHLHLEVHRKRRRRPGPPGLAAAASAVRLILVGGAVRDDSPAMSLLSCRRPQAPAGTAEDLGEVEPVRRARCRLVGSESRGGPLEEPGGPHVVAAKPVGQTDTELSQALPQVSFVRRTGLPAHLTDLVGRERPSLRQQLSGHRQRLLRRQRLLGDGRHPSEP